MAMVILTAKAPVAILTHPLISGGRSQLASCSTPGFVVIEVIYGLASHSVALLADGGHNLSDVLGLAVAWAATVLSKRAPTNRFTYGLGGSSILAAAVQCSLSAGGDWRTELGSHRTFFTSRTGCGQNRYDCGGRRHRRSTGFCAWPFASGRKGDLNVRGAFAHMTADALVSAGCRGRRASSSC